MSDPKNIIFAVCAVMLTVSAFLAIYRIVRGPSVLNRTLASDLMVSILICALGILIVSRRDEWSLPIVVSLSLLGFVASVAVARFLPRAASVYSEPHDMQEE